jgi:diadenosine tetraphosphate (Ap4A) HIT family hydrolase
MAPGDCPFCNPEPDRVFHESGLVIGLWDCYPVSPGHALLVTRRHVTGWFDATPEEQQALTNALAPARTAIEESHRPDGYNIGINCGDAAGQTVAHLHVHLIPRYQGDSDDPRGGVRRLFPDKACYWQPE